jgi:hypothetical protein
MCRYIHYYIMENQSVKNEFIQILEMEIQSCNDVSLKNHMINEIKRFEHQALNKLCYKMGTNTPKMVKVKTFEGKQIGKQNQIDVYKKFQLVCLKHFKYNKSISDDAREYLDIKIGSIYKKIGKLINKHKIKVEQYREYIKNK